MPKQHAGLAAVVSECAVAFDRLTQLSTRLAKDETSTAGAKLVRMAKSVHAEIAPLVDKLDEADNAAAALTRDLQAEMRNAYDPAGKTFETVYRQREIRDFFRGLPESEVMKMLEAAKAENNDEVLFAVAAGQAFLSRLNPGLHQHLRNELIARKHPDHAAVVERLAEQRTVAQVFRSELLQSCADLVDLPRADAIVAAAREDAAA